MFFNTCLITSSSKVYLTKWTKIPVHIWTFAKCNLQQEKAKSRYILLWRRAMAKTSQIKVLKYSNCKSWNKIMFWYLQTETKWFTLIFWFGFGFFSQNRWSEPTLWIPFECYFSLLEKIHFLSWQRTSLCFIFCKANVNLCSGIRSVKFQP